MDIKLKTKRLILRPLTEEEMAARGEKEREPHLKQAYGEMLRGCREDPAHRLWHTCWEIALKSGGPVGELCFKGPPEQYAAEVVYGIFPAFRGNGYATEAVAAALDWAFGEDTGLYYILAQGEADNGASRRVLEKLGFVPPGQGRKGLPYEKERPPANWTSICLWLGMCAGISLGVAIDAGKLALGMSLGMCLDCCLGVTLDAKEKKKRALAKAAREKARAEAGSAT